MTLFGIKKEVERPKPLHLFARIASEASGPVAVKETGGQHGNDGRQAVPLFTGRRYCSSPPPYSPSRSFVNDSSRVTTTVVSSAIVSRT